MSGQQTDLISLSCHKKKTACAVKLSKLAISSPCEFLHHCYVCSVCLFLRTWLNKRVCVCLTCAALFLCFSKVCPHFRCFLFFFPALVCECTVCMTNLQLWSILLRPAESVQHIRRHAKWKYARARRGKNGSTSWGMMTVSLHREVLEASPELQQGNTLKSAAVSCLLRLESVNWSPSLRKVQVRSHYCLQLYYKLPQTSRSYPRCSSYF